ncbi:MAG TPA: efflux RND transporter periplasmic adaptor subunit [Bryobacteraceae bacterium]|nr:efflux RND transporter periplasmic adaptor subunit [Bryobacteraceae bacterium]
MKKLAVMKKLVFRLVILAVVAGAGWAIWALYKAMPQRQDQIATARVRRGDVVVRSYARGELRAIRSATLVAPNLFGTVQITTLAPLGALAREKDLIVEFDDSEVNSRVEEKQLEIEQVDEQMKKAQADLAIRNNQDQVELLRARYSVRRSELEVKRNELLPDIDKKKNVLNLDEARRRLKQLESDVKSRQEQAQAEIAVLQEKRRKAQMELARERQRLFQVKLLSPMTGLVALRQNRGTMFMPGMQIPDLREGDQVQPGMPVADILDLSELELVAKVGELDRANLTEGQDVNMRLDALGDKRFTGKIKSMSGTASANVFSSDPAKKFDVVFSIDMKQLMTALNAKPEQIARVLATAEANRRKPSVGQPMTLGGGGAEMMMARAGAAGGGGLQMTMSSAQGAGPGGQSGPVMFQRPGGEGGRGEGGRGEGGGGRGGMFAQLSEEDRSKMREAMQKALNGRSMRDLSDEERQKVMAQVAKSVPAAAKLVAAQGGMPGQGGREAGRGAAGAPGGAGPAGGGVGGGMPMMMGTGTQFSEKDLASAKLPPAPESDNNLDVLIRPGLLADVEIILERIPNAINVPANAIFEKDGKPVVYVRKGNSWDERQIKPLKRTESTMVIASGLMPGEIVALANPSAKPGEKKKEKPGGAAPVAMPAGGGGGRAGSGS